jgi:hypothetical protein
MIREDRGLTITKITPGAPGSPRTMRRLETDHGAQTFCGVDCVDGVPGVLGVHSVII